jgi:glycosyltransferase involved in cell wall biosynthesis
MTDTVKPIEISYQITEGAGDLYLATVSLLSLRAFATNPIARIEVVIPDPALAQEARAVWTLIAEMGIDIVEAPATAGHDRDPGQGVLISGAPVLLACRRLTIDAGFGVSDGARHVACQATDGPTDAAPPSGLVPLRPALGASSQVSRELFPDISTDRFTSFQETLRRHHRNGFFWDYRYRTNPSLGSGVGSRGIYQTIKRELLNRNVVAPDLSVVDIGCGDLEVCRYLSFKSYIGVDEAPQALALARAKRPDWSFREAPLDTRGGPVAEAALCFEVLIHAPTAEAATALVETLSASASKRIVISGYDHPIPQSSIVYFHAPLRDMLEGLPGWDSPVLIARYENLSVYTVDRTGADLPPPQPLGDADAHPFTWDALTRFEARMTDRLSRLSGSLSNLLERVPVVPVDAAPEPSAALAAPVLATEGPIISVVVAYRNEEARIGAMLASLARQGEPGFEAHLVDDGSDDGSNDIIAEAVGADPRFTIWRNSDTRGPSARRNEGIAAARGKYLYFADGDDALTPDALATLLDTALRTGADVVRGSHLFHFEDGGRSPNMFDQFHQPELDAVTYSAMPSLVFLYTAWNMLIDRDLVAANKLRFDEALNLGEDRIFNQELFSLSRSISLTKHVTYRWIRARGSQRQLSFSRAPDARIAAVLAYLSLFDTLPGATARHRALAQAAMYWEVYRHLLADGQAGALDPAARRGLARIVDMLDFPDALLRNPSIKGWSQDAQPGAHALYLRMRRGRI